MDDAQEVVEVGSAIERLNEAIDAVNFLEDEHQAWTKIRAEKNAVLSCRIAVLEWEIFPFELMASLCDACTTSVRAQKLHATAEQTLARLQEEHAAKQRELASAGLWRARLELNAQLTEIRAAVSTAQKAVLVGRKASTAAGTREDKVRRALQRAREGAGSGSPPEEDELAVFQNVVLLREELETASAEEANIISSMQRRKDAAADDVNAAMAALEEMSNSIHENRNSASSLSVELDRDDGTSKSCATLAQGESGGDSAFLYDPRAQVPWQAGTATASASGCGGPLSVLDPEGGQQLAKQASLLSPTAAAMARWNVSKLFQRRAWESASLPSVGTKEFAAAGLVPLKSESTLHLDVVTFEELAVLLGSACVVKGNPCETQHI